MEDGNTGGRDDDEDINRKRISFIKSMLNDVEKTLLYRLLPIALNRGTTTRELEEMADEVENSSRMFREEIEFKTASRCQKCCGNGNWIFWLVPCVLCCPDKCKCCKGKGKPRKYSEI